MLIDTLLPLALTAATASSVALFATGCVDPLRENAFSVRPVTPAEPITLMAGDSVQLGLQVLDEQEHGVDGVDCLFVVSAPDVLRFESDEVRNAVRVRTARNDALGVRLDGVATVTLSAAEDAEPEEVIVWASIDSATRIAAKAEATASRVWSFAIHVGPSEGLDGGMDASDGDAQ